MIDVETIFIRELRTRGRRNETYQKCTKPGESPVAFAAMIEAIVDGCHNMVMLLNAHVQLPLVDGISISIVRILSILEDSIALFCY